MSDIEQQDEGALEQIESPDGADIVVAEPHIPTRKIMIVGGGSGGHITPLLAVALAVKKADPKVEIAIVGQKGENLQDVVDHPEVDQQFSITAGKFRRYHGESFISHLLDVRTIALNIRDVFRFMSGTFQAWRLLGKYRPDSIMLKGGFVCVPVGFAARLRRIPYLTHDSDAVPGLANRLTAKHARYNTTAMEPSVYPYDPQKTVQVGIPLRKEFSLVSKEERDEFKQELGIDPDDFVLFCTGGGNGSLSLNQMLADISRDLLSEYPKLEIVHLSGHKPFEETKQLYHHNLSEELYNRVRVFDFYPDLYKLSGAADVIISRAGATSIAEFAAQGKACVFVPAPFLTGGQQLHNAEVLSKNGAAFLVEEGEKQQLDGAVRRLLDSRDDRKHISVQLHQLAFADSADKIAELLLELAQVRARSSKVV